MKILLRQRRLLATVIKAALILFATFATTSRARAHEVPKEHYPLGKPRIGAVRHQLGLNFTVPVLLTEEADLVRPGFGFDFRYGIDTGYLVPEFGFGFGRNRLDVAPVDSNGMELDDGHLRAMHFRLGLRAQIPNRSSTLPYLGASFDFSWWKFPGDLSCSAPYCRGDSRFSSGRGLTIRAGSNIFLSPTTAFDLGVQFSTLFPDSITNKAEVIVGPYFGFAFRSM